ncbi:MAG: TasA family protein [Coriobacteriia bacterium]|nr:TasA family protein [Coriobacteriia bacterium]
MKKLILFVLTALAVLTVGAAGAYFTGQATVADNVIKAGTVAVSTEPTSAAISIDALAPGATTSKTLTVVNDGNLAESIVVTAAKKAGTTAFYEALTVRVTADGVALYDGPMTALKTAPLTITPGARAQLQFAVGLPAEAGNDLAGTYAKLTLYVDAEQVH